MRHVANRCAAGKRSHAMMDVMEISARGMGFTVSLSEKNGFVLLVRGDKEIMEVAGDNFFHV